MEKSIRYIIIGALVALHAIFRVPQFFYGHTPLLLRSVAYNFFHVSWWHLAVNCLAVWTLFPPGRKVSGWQLALALLIAVAVYPFSTRPILGASNFLYAYIGLRTPALESPWWRKTPTLVFLSVTVAMVFIPRIAGLPHIFSFAGGVFLAGTGRILKELTRDTRRYL